MTIGPITILHVLLFGAAVAALALAAGGLAARRGGRAAGAFFAVFILIAGAAAGRGILDVRQTEQAAMRDTRRALDARANDLAIRALVPQSPLACLDAGAGDAVEGGCEKALFASPQSVASAVTYVAARIALLRDAQAFGERYDRDYANMLVPLARALESDRYGFVAQVLATRDGCTPESCALFAALPDASMVKINLQSRTYDAYVAKYAPSWGGQAAPPPTGPVAKATPGSAGENGEPEAAASSGTVEGKVVNHIDFPTASSIPPVSIMDPEPPLPGKGAPVKPEEKGPPIPVPPATPPEVAVDVPKKPAAATVATPRPKPPAKPAASTGAAPQR